MYSNVSIKCRNSSIFTQCDKYIPTENMESIFVCAKCGREYKEKTILLRHMLIHNACASCGKHLSHLRSHTCRAKDTEMISANEALKPYLHSYHYLQACKSRPTHISQYSTYYYI